MFEHTQAFLPAIEITRDIQMPLVENTDGGNISLHVNLFRAYLEASAIRHHAAQFNYIFSGVPCKFAEGIEPIRDNFQLSFRQT